MKDKEARKRLDNIENQLQVKWCEYCKLYTLKCLTIKTIRGGEEAIVIPQKIGETYVLCEYDKPYWYCLQCNGVKK